MAQGEYNVPGVLCPIVSYSGQGSRDPFEPLVIRPTSSWSGSLVFSLVNCMEEATCGIPLVMSNKYILIILFEEGVCKAVKYFQERSHENMV